MDQPYITLNRTEWKDVHNALCTAEILHPVGKGRQAIQAIRDALAPAYAQDNQTFDMQWSYFKGIQDTCNFRSKWSLYDEVGVGEIESPHPYTGAQFIVYDNHWGDTEVVKEIAGDTWLDLWRAAESAIEASGDSHHSFIESFIPIQDRAGHLRLTTGS